MAQRDSPGADIVAGIAGAAWPDCQEVFAAQRSSAGAIG